MSSSNIPKIIHYCWFGRGKKPKKIEKCIQTWKEVLYDYEFIEWNETNFNVNDLEYTKQAYVEKKYAFVSDVARIMALKKYGGIYLDTDVIVKKDFSKLLNHSCILGFEERNYIATSFMAVEKDTKIINEFLEVYKTRKFYLEDGTIDTTTNVQVFNKLLKKRGLNMNGKYQELQDDIVVYPKEYFSPYDYRNCIDKSSSNTYCIHLFYVTWLPFTARIKKVLKKIIVPIIGVNKMEQIRQLGEKNENKDNNLS